MQSKDIFKEQKRYLKDLLCDIRKNEQITQNDSFYFNHNSIIKAQFILMLYTMLESVIMQSIQDIFDNIENSKISINATKDCIKTIYFKAKIKNKERGFNAIVSDQFFMQTVQDILDNKILSINLMNDFKQENPFGGGSLDYKKIEEKIYNQFDIANGAKTTIERLSNKYNLDISKNIKDIKDYRNKLAHGEQTFQDIGKNKAYKDLKQYYVSIVFFIICYMIDIENYTINQKYVK